MNCIKIFPLVFLFFFFFQAFALQIGGPKSGNCGEVFCNLTDDIIYWGNLQNIPSTIAKTDTINIFTQPQTISELLTVNNLKSLGDVNAVNFYGNGSFLAGLPADTNCAAAHSCTNVIYSGDNVSLLANNAGYITASSTDLFTNKSGNISMWTNDASYLTAFNDTNWQTSFPLLDANLSLGYYKQSDLNNNNLFIKTTDSNNAGRLAYGAIADLNNAYYAQLDANVVFTKITDVNGTFAKTSDINFAFLRNADVNMVYVRQSDGNVWYAKITDVNGNFAKTSDINSVFLRNADVNMVYVRQSDGNVWYAKITDVNGNFAKTSDVNFAFLRNSDVNMIYVRQSDGNNWYIKQTDTNNVSRITYGAIADLNKAYYTQLDANTVLFKISDANNAGRFTYTVIANPPWITSYTDTNWQTSFSIFDANMALRYVKQSDGNVWYAKITDINGTYQLKADMNQQYYAQTDANNVFLKLTDSNNTGRLKYGVLADFNAAYYSKTDANANFVPYVGAISSINLGDKNLTTTGTGAFGIGKFTTGINDNVGTLSIDTNARKLYAFTEGTEFSDPFQTIQLDYSLPFSLSIAGAGTPVDRSYFMGDEAGYGATNATRSNFYGQGAGQFATNAEYSNFFGVDAGMFATNAKESIFIGSFAGFQDTVDNVTTYPNGTSIAIGKYSGTGGYSDSVAIGHGVKNSGANEMNLGNVMKLTGIYASDTPSSAFLAGSKVKIGGDLNVQGFATIGTGKAMQTGLVAGDLNISGNLYVQGTSPYIKNADLNTQYYAQLDANNVFLKLTDSNNTGRLKYGVLADFNAAYYSQTDLNNNNLFIKVSDSNNNSRIKYGAIADLNKAYYTQLDLNGNGLFAKTSDINTIFARTTDINGTYQLKADMNQQYYAQTDANNVFLKLTGGTLTGDLNIGDNISHYFGTGKDLAIYHDGTDNNISTLTAGNLNFTTFTRTATSESASNFVFIGGNGAPSGAITSAGVGGGFTVKAGQGGISGWSTAAGKGGTITLISGTGNQGLTSSAGGDFVMTSGAGGYNPNYNGGAGGFFYLTSGVGGATAGTGIWAGGIGGDFVLAGGTGGASNGIGGQGGSAYFNPGAGGIGTDTNGSVGIIGIAVNPTAGTVFGKVGLGRKTPTAYLHIAPGTVTANTAPLKFTQGELNTTPEEGAIEFRSDNLYYSTALSARNKIVSANATGDAIIADLSELGAEKLNSTNFAGTSWTAGTGWVGDTTTIGYVFTVSGITTTPAVGSTYTNNGITYTTLYTKLTLTGAKFGTMMMSASGNPLTAPDYLIKATGTGDANITYSAYSRAGIKGSAGTGTLTQAGASMVTPVVANEYYQLKFTIANRNSASVVPSCGGVTLPTRGGGTAATGGGDMNVVEYFLTTSTADLVFTPTTASRLTLNNISLKRITGGDLQTLGNIILGTASGTGLVAGDLNASGKIIGNNGISSNMGYDINGTKGLTQTIYVINFDTNAKMSIDINAGLITKVS